MTREEFEMLTQEQQNEVLEQVKNARPIIMKCKPCFNFQSIEFEYEVRDNDDMQKMFDNYRFVLDWLIDNSPEVEQNNYHKQKVSKNVQKQAKNADDKLATDAQKRIMEEYGISYNCNTTLKQAQEKIKNSIANKK